MLEAIVKPGSTSFYTESDGEHGNHDIIAIFVKYYVLYSNIVLDEDYGEIVAAHKCDLWFLLLCYCSYT